MTLWTLILRSLRFHARPHLGVLLGAAIGSAVLIGALLVGDSVRESLREMGLMRLGKVDVAMSSGDRFVRTQLASDLRMQMVFGAMTSGGIPTNHAGVVAVPFAAPALQVFGTVSKGDGSARANRVQVMGVDPRFWFLGEEHDAPGPASAALANAVVVNRRLAEQLSVKAGDTVLVRVGKPSALSRDAPLTPQDDTSIALRVTITDVASEKRFGQFSLQANQVAPFNIFVPLRTLQQQLGLTNRVNLVLVGQPDGLPVEAVKAFEGVGQVLSNAVDSALLGQSTKPAPAPRAVHKILQADDVPLKPMLTLADAELELRELPGAGDLELRTSRVFLDPPIVEAALKAATNASVILTYFVNELRVGNRATPYSMVTAMGEPVVPADMKDDEIAINQWLADDLQAKPGDTMSLSYYAVGLSRALEERTNTFRIRAILPMTMPFADHELMPEFPGVAKAESTSEWDGSLPINVSKIRSQDEKYWKDWRGTPKAFITRAAGEKIWSNRFGSVTAIRFSSIASAKTIKTPGGVIVIPAEQSPSRIAAWRAQVEKGIMANLDPSSIGLRFEPVREQALNASAQAQDFGGLFIGFSFFLIVAALLLMALLFQFGIEQRSVEVGTLLALGFTPKQVRRLLLLEGLGIAVIGGGIGVVGGIWYARAMLRGLSTVWQKAVGTTALQFHATPMTLVTGALASVLVAAFTIWLALRKQAARPARELLADENVEFQPVTVTGKKRSWSGKIAIGSFVLALATVGYAMTQKEGAAESFFSAGSFLLIGALAAVATLLTKLNRSETAAKLSLTGMGVRNATRRRKRSLATVAMLACGSFLIASMGVFRLDENENATKRHSGTGGFALIGESTLPVVQDLNSEAGRAFYGLDNKALTGVSVVPMRVRDGDDASCLNLNRAQKPRLLGVKPEMLAGRDAFISAGVAKGLPAEKPWLLLKQGGGDSVPAIADEASILWALGKKLGDTLPYTDERGRTFNVRLVGALANSVLQGNLLIDEAEFARRFPGESGYRMFLIDAPSNQAKNVSDVLTKQLQDAGMQLMPAPRRLAEFNAVQNTYLSTFQVLGGLGLLLGSAGLGVVVLRNVLERRGELALLLAVGFRAQSLKWLVLSEHGALLILGLASGVAAALVAVLPTVLSPGAEVPYLSLGLTLGAVLLSGALWTWVATLLALRGKLLDALRNA